jgi:NAD(P)H dehydrogenase (quinone)
VNVLVINAHPNRKSLTYAFSQKIVEGSEENPHISHIEVLDLYQDKFNPVLEFNETKRRRDMYQDANFDKYREKITWADKLVFVYPIWWGRPPAILLGFFDQVFAANFAYNDQGGIFPEGLLKGKSAICISTMKGPANYPLVMLNNCHKVLMKRAVLNVVGIKRVTFFEFGNMESSSGKQDKKLNKIYRYFTKLVN